MVKVSVMGATGYTGAELVKILARHGGVEIVSLTSESLAGERYSSIYPAFKNVCDMVLDDSRTAPLAEKSDAVFLCLPHGAGMDATAELLEKNVKVFDLSADYRLQDPLLYESVYKTPHKHPELLKEAVYGLAEIFYREIASARLVAVPGCYPTSVLLPLLPFLNENALDLSYIIADSKSGVSGAGKKPTETTHYCEVNENFKPYAIFSHRHKQEMDSVIKRAAGVGVGIIFTPHLTPLTRGMLSTVYTRSPVAKEALMDIWKTYYADKPAVRIHTDGAVPAVSHVANTAFIDMALFKNGDNVIMISAIDNLLKGASSQAVQCFNLNMGFPVMQGLC